jgi:hypothetical protein
LFSDSVFLQKTPSVVFLDSLPPQVVDAQPPPGDGSMLDEEQDEQDYEVPGWVPVVTAQTQEVIASMKALMEDCVKRQTQELIAAVKAQMEESFGQGATVLLNRGPPQLPPQLTPQTLPKWTILSQVTPTPMPCTVSGGIPPQVLATEASTATLVPPHRYASTESLIPPHRFATPTSTMTSSSFSTPRPTTPTSTVVASDQWTHTSVTPAASVLPVFPASVTPATGHMLDGQSYVRYPLRPDTFSPPLRPNRPMSTPPVHDMDTDTEFDFLESPNTMSGDRSPMTDDITTTPRRVNNPCTTVLTLLGDSAIWDQISLMGTLTEFIIFIKFEMPYLRTMIEFFIFIKLKCHI